MSDLDRRAYVELDAVALERSIVIRLVQEGFAVVAPNAAPELRIRLTRSGRRVQLAVQERITEVEVDLRRLREFHLEVAQKAVELTRAAAAALPPFEPAKPPEPEPEAPKPPEPPPPPRAPSPRPQWNVLAAGGVLLRAPGVDPRFVLAGRFAPSSLVGVHLEAGLAPIPGSSLSAYDGALLLGAGLQVIGGVFRLEVGLSLGAQLHVFAVELPIAEERMGSRVDFVGRPFVRAALNPVGGFLVWLQVGAGLSSRPREHRLRNETLYVRGALWLDAVIGLGWET